MTFLKMRESVALLFAAVALLTACQGSNTSFAFSAVSAEIAMQSDATLDVRLVDKSTGNLVDDAVIFESRFDMSPDAMGAMTAPAEAQGSPSPGVYRFKVSPTMAGRWALTLSAKVQGVDETVTGVVVVTVR